MNSCNSMATKVLYKLNLGRFDQCVNYLSLESQQPVPLHSTVFCCNPYVGDTQKIVISGNPDEVDAKEAFVTIPSVDVGVALDGGKICDQNVVNSLLSKIELKIFKIISHLIEESEQVFKMGMENVKITVKNIQFFDDDKTDGCYGWADVSIAVIVERKQ